jgi:hypothetical protein
MIENERENKERERMTIPILLLFNARGAIAVGCLGDELADHEVWELFDLFGCTFVHVVLSRTNQQLSVTTCDDCRCSDGIQSWDDGNGASVRRFTMTAGSRASPIAIEKSSATLVTFISSKAYLSPHHYNQYDFPSRRRYLSSSSGRRMERMQSEQG